MNPTLGQPLEDEIAPRIDWELVRLGLTFVLAVAVFGGAVYATLRITGVV